MTNKIPEVGKRYRPITTKPISSRSIEITKVSDVHHTEGSMPLCFFYENYEELPEDNSSQKHNIKTQAEPIVNKSESQVNYEFAKEDLEKEIEQLQGDDCFFKPKYATEDLLQKQLARLMDKSQNLINALDSKEPKVNVSVDLGKEGGDMTCEVYWKDREDGIREIIDIKYKEPKKETKLPWKDVSELPEREISETVFLRYKNGDIFQALWDGKGFKEPVDNIYCKTTNLKEWTYLTDLINSIESILSRQDELEERVRKLEGNNE